MELNNLTVEPIDGHEENSTKVSRAHDLAMLASRLSQFIDAQSIAGEYNIAFKAVMAADNV